MAEKSSIEWTDATWNPVTGCTKVSPGCKHCYAETFAERWRGVPGHPYEQGFDLRLWPERLETPLKWKSPRTVFVNSMSDLFHEQIPDEFLDRVFRVMVTASWHTFQVLTKRALRMAEWHGKHPEFWNVSNIWLGVSVEDRRFGLPRIPPLRTLNSSIRFLSVEPLLEDLGQLNLDRIDWVIVGGESGHGARPMKREWVISVRDQCRRSRIPFFFKQWGGVWKKEAGRLLNGRTWDGMPSLSPHMPSQSPQEGGDRRTISEGLR